MKHIKFQSISLVNFKAFRSFTLDFNEEVTNIYGRNESGKTTILDAIMWCLFNKDHLFRSTFAIKTHDENGNDIPNLEHSVELKISVDGIERTLKRVLKEKWVKERGEVETRFSGNYQECYVDGNLYSSKDFATFISTFIGEQAFKSITSPTYFLSLPWQSKRDFLQHLAGEITEEDITGGDSKYNPLLEELKKQTLEEYTKHLRNTIREVKKKLDMIPVRISEQEKALPKKEDWDTLENTLREKQQELDEYIRKAKINSTLSPEELRIKGIEDKIKVQKDKQAEREGIVKTLYQKRVKDQKQVYEKAQQEIKERRKEIDMYDQSIRTMEANKTISKEILEQCEKDTLIIRTEWAEIQKRKFELSPEMLENCPACSKLSPGEACEPWMNSLKKEFNRKKAEDLAALKEKAEEIKKKKKDAEGAISAVDKNVPPLERIIKDSIDVIEGKKKILPYPEEVYTDMLMADDEYTKAEEEICKLRLEIKSEEKDEPQVKRSDYKAERDALNEEIKNLTATLALKVQYEKGMSYIQGIKEENKALAQQLADKEKELDLASDYEDRSFQILEERVNKHFSLVRWKMFRTRINAPREQYCECTFKGTEANDGLNSAGYIMAGVDICNAIAKFFKVSAPIIIDNAESINQENFIPSEGQQIRLFVSDDEKLIIK